MTHFAKMRGGGLLAATAMDIVMKVPDLTFDELEVDQISHMSVVLAVSLFMMGGGERDHLIIDSFARKRWREACKISHYTPKTTGHA